MKFSIPKYWQGETATAFLKRKCWRGALLYVVLLCLCLGGNCGIWSDFVAAPLRATPIIGVVITHTVGVSTNSPI